MKKLIIDLGHGGSDSGAVGKNNTYESNIVLAIGKELNQNLINFPIEIKFTRLSNKYLSLSERVNMANNFNANYFISIHINSTTDKSVRGVEIWQYTNSNNKINSFSSSLCNDISKTLNIKNRGIKISKEFTVLKNTKMPAALIEVDFISNINAEKALSENKNIEKIALAIKDNILDLFDINKNENNELYKVCIGAYKEKSNAINQVSKAKEKGFKDAYII